MDVRLPGGMIVSNVPEGTTQKDLLDTLAQNGYDVAPIQRQFMFKIGKEGMGEAARQVGESQGLAQKISTGLGSAAQRTATGLAEVNQAINPLAALSQKLFGVGSPPNQEALDVAKATVQGAGPIAQIADIAGSIAMTAGAPTRALGLAPTRAKTVLDTALTSGLITGLTTPGDIGTRTKEGAISAGMSTIAPAVVGMAQSGRRVATRAGRELGKAEELRREIGDDAASAIAAQLKTPYQNAPLGVSPTAAMQTQNPTLQALELGSRVKRPDLFAGLDDANAIARWNALQGIAKDDAALAAAQATRDRVTSGLREEALGLASQKPDFASAVRSKVDDLLSGESRSSPAVQNMAKYVQRELDQGVTPQQLYTIRKTLTDAVPMGTELGAGIKLARAERIALVKSIDDALDQASDGAWGLYLKTYSGFSQPVTSMKAGQSVAQAFEHTPNRTSAATGGIPVMTPAALSKAVDRFGTKQFGGTTVKRFSQAEQNKLAMIVDDLRRQQEVMRARGIVGSDTAAKLASADRGDAIAAGLVGQAVDRISPLPIGGLLASQASRGLARKREEALANLLMNPAALAKALDDAAKAQRLLAASAATSRAMRGPGN